MIKRKILSAPTATYIQYFLTIRQTEQFFYVSTYTHGVMGFEYNFL